MTLESTDIVEHCRMCEEPCKLEFAPGDYVKKAGHIEDHSTQMWSSRIDGVHTTKYKATPLTSASSEIEWSLRCSGSGKRSMEFRDGNLKKKHDRVIELVDQVKLDAEIAYDAWQENRTGFDYQLLISIALRDYARRWPSSRKYTVFSTSIIRGGKVATYKMDVYCTFCRGLLCPRVSTASAAGLHPKVLHHTTGCAILCLAGRREMVAPDQKRLIDEDRTFPDDTLGDLCAT